MNGQCIAIGVTDATCLFIPASCMLRVCVFFYVHVPMFGVRLCWKIANSHDCDFIICMCFWVPVLCVCANVDSALVYAILLECPFDSV